MPMPGILLSHLDCCPLVVTWNCQGVTQKNNLGVGRGAHVKLIETGGSGAAVSPLVRMLGGKASLKNFFDFLRPIVWLDIYSNLVLFFFIFFFYFPYILSFRALKNF